jgi:hypothetical protein
MLHVTSRRHTSSKQGGANFKGDRPNTGAGIKGQLGQSAQQQRSAGSAAPDQTRQTRGKQTTSNRAQDGAPREASHPHTEAATSGGGTWQGKGTHTSRSSADYASSKQDSRQKGRRVNCHPVPIVLRRTRSDPAPLHNADTYGVGGRDGQTLFAIGSENGC